MKSILSEQREADEALCRKLLLISGALHLKEVSTLATAASDAIARIRALHEELREACHERDGLLAKVQRHAS